MNPLAGLDGYGQDKIFWDIRITSVKHILYILVVEFLHGRHFSTSSRSSSGPNLRIHILHKFTYKMQVGIPVAYNVCEVKPDNVNHSICVNREEFVSCDSVLKLQDKITISYRVCKNTERTDCIFTHCVFTHPITNCTFNLQFDILPQLKNSSFCTHIQSFILSGFTLHTL